MKHLLTTLLLATLCASGYGQTIKSLGYNTTNNRVIGPTNTNPLVFTNIPDFDNGAFFGGDVFIKNNGINFGGSERINLEEARFIGEWVFDQPATWRTNLGLGWPALTNTNAATSLLGINASNQVVVATNIIFTNGVAFTTNAAAATLANLGLGTNASVTISNLNVQSVSITNADTFRTNIGIPLPALTNTSNVTMIRALAGSTNTNEPFSGLIEFKNSSDDVFEATISNGIIVKIVEP
jgi:hypothetical protein